MCYTVAVAHSRRLYGVVPDSPKIPYLESDKDVSRIIPDCCTAGGIPKKRVKSRVVTEFRDTPWTLCIDSYWFWPLRSLQECQGVTRIVRKGLAEQSGALPDQLRSVKEIKLQITIRTSIRKY